MSTIRVTRQGSTYHVVSDSVSLAYGDLDAVAAAFPGSTIIDVTDDDADTATFSPRTPEDIFNESNRSDASDITSEPCTDSAPCERRACDACFARHGGDPVAIPASEPTEYEVIARKLIDAATDRRVGGTSIWQGESADHGYLVGLPGRGLVIPREVVPHAHGPVTLAYVARWVESTHALPYAATWGSWLDRNTGIVYLDVSSHYANFAEAVTACQSRGEIALWDIADGIERRV